MENVRRSSIGFAGKRFGARQAGTAAACVLACCAPVPGEPAEPTAAGQESGSGLLQEVVVTSQRRSENLQDVPIAVSALSGDVLSATSVEAQVALPRITTGLSMNVGSGFTQPYIRGIGTTFATLGLEPSVATYFDDQYIARPVAGYFAFNDVERIEVLKGPQGTLYGRNAAAGAIRVITNDPTSAFEARGSVTYGRFDRRLVSGVVNLPLSSELSARVSAGYERRDSYVEAVDPQHGPRDKSETMMLGKLLWKPSDVLSAKLTLDYARVRDPQAVSFILVEREPPASIGLVRGGTPSPGFYKTTSAYGPGTSDPDNLTRTSGVQLRVDYELGHATFSSMSGYRWTDMSQHGEQDATEVPYSHFLFAESAKAYSQEFQLVSDQDSRFTWLTGLYYYVEKGENDYESYGQVINDSFGLPYGPTIGTIDGNPVFALLGRARTEAVAPYAEGTLDLTGRLKLTVGARYTWEEKTLLSNHNVVRGLGPELPVFSETDRKFDFRKFTPKATISYHPSAAVLLYLTYSRGFKSGGFSLPSAAVATRVDPEVVDAFELGYKTEFDRIRLNGSIFSYDYRDLQVQRPNDVGGVVLENAADARIYGLDVDAVWAATERLEIGLGASYLKAEYDTYLGTANVPASTTPDCAAAGGPVPPYPAACIGYVNVAADFSGRTMVNAPELTAYGRVQYRRTLPAGMGAVFLNGLLSYSDEYFYNPERSLIEPSKVLLSVSMTWMSETDRFSVSVLGDNLLGEEYDIYKTVIVPSGAYRIPGAPRTWSVRFDFSF